MDDLTLVRAELRARKGTLRKISEETGIAYDTVLRIMNEEGDPGYSKVAILRHYLFPAGVPMPSAVHDNAAAA